MKTGPTKALCCAVDTPIIAEYSDSCVLGQGRLVGTKTTREAAVPGRDPEKLNVNTTAGPGTTAAGVTVTSKLVVTTSKSITSASALL